MQHIIILALDGSPLSSIALPADILTSAGTMWNSIAGLKPEPLFSVSIVSPDGGPVRCHNSIEIKPDGSLADITSADVLIVGAITLLDNCAKRHGDVIRTLHLLHRQGTVLASICSGAFLLAATGLLDRKPATTHWGLGQQFSSRYPKVQLDISRTVTDAGSLICSGGAYAGADLALHLIRRFYGNDAANRCARVLLLDPQRTRQSPYEIMNIRTDHGDSHIADVQEWLAANCQREITIEILAANARMSRRTFERRFKEATGESPLRYLQRLRVEKAKHLLETGMQTFDEITSQVGYQDTSSFRRMFQKSTGLPPTAYREKFRRPGNQRAAA